MLPAGAEVLLLPSEPAASTARPNYLVFACGAQQPGRDQRGKTGLHLIRGLRRL